MLGIFADLIASCTTILLPAYLSYKSIRAGDPAQTTPWLIYFIMLSLALLFESWTVFIIGWLPFYSWFRLLFLLYLVLPQTQGAKVLYLSYLEPYIIDHETKIDKFIGETHASLERLGLGYLSFVVDWLRERVLGQASPQQPTSQSKPGVAGGYSAQAANYASDLLSRFAMPQARTQPHPAAGGLSSFLSAALGPQAASSAGTSRSVSDSHASGSSIPGLASLQSFLSNPDNTSADKSKLLQTNRDQLTGLLRALDKEQQSLDLAYGSTPGPGMGAKSRSQQSFEQVSYDDVRSAPSAGGYGPQSSRSSARTERDHTRTTSGGWSSGWFGGASADDAQGRRHDDREDELDRGYDRERVRERERDRDREGGDWSSKGWSAARDITDAVMNSGVEKRR